MPTKKELSITVEYLKKDVVRQQERAERAEACIRHLLKEIDMAIPNKDTWGATEFGMLQVRLLDVLKKNRKET